MAFNTPNPPEPNEPGYPPLLMYKQLLQWLRKIKFEEEPTKSLLVADEDFREYFLGVVNMSAFILGQLRYKSISQKTAQNANNSDEDSIPMFSTSSSGDGTSIGAAEGGTEEKAKEDKGEEKNEAAEDSSSGEIAIVEDLDEAFEGQEAVEEGTIVEGHILPTEAYVPKFCDPLQHVASEVFVLLLHGLLKLYRETESSGKSLYDKYKNMNEGATPESALEDLIRSTVPALAEIVAPSEACRHCLHDHPLFETAITYKNTKFKLYYELASIIDEEMIIIHPEHKKGFKAFVSGCSDNKILALASHLIQQEESPDARLIPGKRPPPEVQQVLEAWSPQAPEEGVKWAHPWTFSGWTCVTPGTGKVPTGMAGASHWIWPEGTPIQIQKWNGLRVLILGKAPFPKKFDPVRVFNGAQPFVQITEFLDEAQISNIIEEIAKTPANVREEAIKAHKTLQPTK